METTYNLKISETKFEKIVYAGYLLDNCYVFCFEDGGLYYLPSDRINLYLSNGKLITKTI